MANFTKLPEMRVAFACLDKPQVYKGKDGVEGKPTFSITCIFPKADKITYKTVRDLLESAISANGNWKAEKKKQVLNKCLRTMNEDGLNLNCVIRDGDELNKQALLDGKTVYEHYKDSWVIKFKRPASFGAALVVDRAAKEVPGSQIASVIRPGYHVIVEASVYVYDGTNPGASLQMQGVQLRRKDEEFGRQNNFEAVEGLDDESDDETFKD